MGDRKRDEVIAFRVTAAERTQINKNIRKSGLSQREYLLNAALGQAIHVVEELKSILSELRACGRNLNQLVTLAHMGRVTVIDLESVCRAFSELCGAVRMILERKRW